MIGLILGAGAGSRLGDLTADRPKPLLEVSDGRTIADTVLANFAAVGIREVVVVAGYRIEPLMNCVERLERTHGVAITVVANPFHRSRNNCYSLWLARHWFDRDVLLSNGDTMHHPDVERAVLETTAHEGLVLAVQRGHGMGEEEMKVAIDDEGRVTGLSKGIDPRTAHGEYIGVARLLPSAGPLLTRSLEAVIRRDPGLYYEDAFALFAAEGGSTALADIGGAPWVEVDTEVDLARARELACRF